MLVGLVAKNAILIVEFAKEEVEKGRDAVSAALTAMHLRFRPIVMTSLSFILGLLPLVFASGPSIATIYNNRGYFDMRKLQTFSATKFRELVRAFTRLDFNPNLYADTLFYGPDLLNVYKATGYVLMKDSVYPNNLLCMVDIEDTTRVSVRSVPNAVIRSLLVSDLHDLSNVCCKNPRSDLTIREVC